MYLTSDIKLTAVCSFIFLMLFLPAVSGSAEANPQKASSSRIFHSENRPGSQVLDLNTACRRALADNPGLQASQERIVQARELVRQSKADYWPNLSLEASGSRNWLSQNDRNNNFRTDPFFTGFPSADNPLDIGRSALTAGWLVFDGFQRRYRTAASRFGLQRSRAGDQEAARLLLSAVAEAYYSALLAGENSAIALADERFNQRQLQDARARRMAGTGSLSDVLNFRIRVNTARNQRISAESSLRSNRAALAALMGLPEADMPEEVKLADLPGESREELRLPEIQKEIQYALANRPDLRQQSAAELEAESEVKAARSEFFPDLSLSYSLEGERTGDFTPDGQDFGHSLALIMSLELFDGGSRAARVRQTQARRREISKDQADLRLQVGSEVRQALAELISARDRLLLERSNLELVERTRDLVAREYAAGQTSLVRLNEAQRDFTAAKARLAQAMVSFRLAGFRLDVETGRILARFLLRP